MTQPAQSLPSYLSSLPDFADPAAHSSPLPSLYSSLAPLRSSNPSAYRANVDWWRRHLSEAVYAGAQPASKGKERETAATPRLVLVVDEALLDGWTVEEVGRPMGIGTVVKELQSSHHLVAVRDFLSANTPISGPSTASSSSSGLTPRSVAAFVVGKPLWWALGQLGIGGGNSSESSEEDEMREWRAAKGQWVVWDNLQAASDAVLAEHYDAGRLSPLDSLYTLAAFKKLISRVQPHLTDLDIQLLLKHLSRDRNVARIEKGLVKLSPSEHEAVEAITQDDRNLIAVKETRDRLETQIADIEARVADRQTRAAAALKAKQKSQAVAYLKEKKMLLELLDRRLGSKSTLDGVLLKIEQAAGDVEIMASYQTSTDVLKKLLQHDNLQMDRVETTMEGLQDALADQREIDGVIQSSGGEAAGGVDIDEDELKEEMQRLEEEEKRERERERVEAEKAAQRKEQQDAQREQREREEAQQKREQEEERQRQQQQGREDEKKRAEEEAVRKEESRLRREKQAEHAQSAVVED